MHQRDVARGPGEKDKGDWSTNDLRHKSEVDEDAREELDQRSGDEAYPNGRDDD